MKRLSVIGFMICLYLNGMAGTAGMEVVKRRLCESYFRVLNNAPELRAEIKQFNRGSRNPDIMIRELKEGSEEEEVLNSTTRGTIMPRLSGGINPLVFCPI